MSCFSTSQKFNRLKGFRFSDPTEQIGIEEDIELVAIHAYRKSNYFILETLCVVYMLRFFSW